MKKISNHERKIYERVKRALEDEEETFRNARLRARDKANSPWKTRS